MTTAIAKKEKWTPELVTKVRALKDTVAKGASSEDFEIFLHQAQRTGLDPLSRQIYCIVRNSWDPQTKGYVPKATIQTSIDGLRIVAERTGRYVPGEDTTYQYNDFGNLVSATATVIKMINGKDYPVRATAYYDEYVQTHQDRKTGKTVPTSMWAKMPRLMLAKCAEALALRKAFPNDLSGIYGEEEMTQVDSQIIDVDQPGNNDIAPTSDEDDEVTLLKKCLAIGVAGEQAMELYDVNHSSEMKPEDWKDLRKNLMAYDQGAKIETLFPSLNESKEGALYREATRTITTANDIDALADYWAGIKKRVDSMKNIDRKLKLKTLLEKKEEELCPQQ